MLEVMKTQARRIYIAAPRRSSDCRDADPWLWGIQAQLKWVSMMSLTASMPMKICKTCFHNQWPMSSSQMINSEAARNLSHTCSILPVNLH